LGVDVGAEVVGATGATGASEVGVVGVLVGRGGKVKSGIFGNVLGVDVGAEVVGATGASEVGMVGVLVGRGGKVKSGNLGNVGCGAGALGAVGLLPGNMG